MTSLRRLGVGLVGTGFMGEVHARAARSVGARLVAVVGSSPARGREAVARLGAECAYETVEELLVDDSVEVVHVVTPNALHADQATAVLRAGKHLVCEKPLATTAAEASQLVALAADAGVVATVPFVYRFHPMAREARALLSGAHISTFSGAYLQDWLLGPDADNWRTSTDLGGPSRAFADIGSHLVDLLEYVTGDRVRRLAGVARTFEPVRAGHPVTTEDAVALVAELTGGAIGTLLTSQVAPGHKNGLAIEVSTAGSSIRFDQENPNSLWIGRATGDLVLQRGAPGLSTDTQRLSTVPPGHPQGYLDAFTSFIADAYAAIEGDVPPGLPTVTDGYRAALITEAVLRTARTQAWVDVPTVENHGQIPSEREK